MKKILLIITTLVTISANALPMKCTCTTGKMTVNGDGTVGISCSEKGQVSCIS